MSLFISEDLYPVLFTAIVAGLMLALWNTYQISEEAVKKGKNDGISIDSEKQQKAAKVKLATKKAWSLKKELEDEKKWQIQRRKNEESLLKLMFEYVHENLCLVGGRQQPKFRYKSQIWMMDVIQSFDIKKINQKAPPDNGPSEEGWIRWVYNNLHEHWSMDFNEETKLWLYNLVRDYDLETKRLDRPIDCEVEDGAWILVMPEWPSMSEESTCLI